MNQQGCVVHTLSLIVQKFILFSRIRIVVTARRVIRYVTMTWKCDFQYHTAPSALDLL